MAGSRAASRCRSRLGFPQHQGWVDLFMGWWEYAIRSWRRRAKPDAILTFLCELGPAALRHHRTRRRRALGPLAGCAGHEGHDPQIVGPDRRGGRARRGLSGLIFAKRKMEFGRATRVRCQAINSKCRSPRHARITAGSGRPGWPFSTSAGGRKLTSIAAALSLPDFRLAPGTSRTRKTYPPPSDQPS